MGNNEQTLCKLMPQLKVSDDFDPNALLTKVRDESPDGTVSESLYMRYKASMAWFLTVYPNGCFTHTFNVLDRQRATVTASIYRQPEDTKPASMATCTRYYEETADGRYYEQNAVTAAYRKALDYLGFGTPICAHEVDGIEVISKNAVPEMTDAGVVLPSPAVPDTTATKKEVDEPSKPPQTAADLGTTPVEDVLEQATRVETIAPVAPAEKMAAAPKQMSMDTPVAPTASAASTETVVPAVAEKIPTSLAEALLIRFPYGAYRGHTIEEVAQEKGDKFIRWHADKVAASAQRSPFAVATQIYCEQRGC